VAIVLSCECGRKLQISDEFAGQEGQCPSCGRTMIIPGGDGSEMNGAADNGFAVVNAVQPEAVVADKSPEPPTVVPSEEKLTNHGGGPLSRDSDFFAEAPEEIGPVLSAHTTLMTTTRPWSGGGRLVAAGLAGLFGLGIGAGIVLIFEPLAEFWHVFWPTLGTIVGLLIAFAATRFSHTCTYVGRDGVARFNCAGNRNRITGAERFLFRDAAELRTGQTVRYHNGSYQGTDYTFIWTDVGGRKRYGINGTHKAVRDLPPSTDPYHYGLASELAWTASLLAQTQRQFELAGSVPFNLKGGHSVRVSPGGLTIQLGGEPLEWPLNEIDAIMVEKGTVKIKRADAQEGWFSSKGVAKFPFEHLANARLFLHVVNRVLGIRIG
jgi:hypothetical protein